MSTFSHTIFDVEVEQRVDPSALDWPEGARFRSGDGLGGNRDYEDMRRLPWSMYREAIAYERMFMTAWATASEDEQAEMIEALYEDEDTSSLCALDPGVASTVLALSASRCAPYASCNGGAFEGGHHEDYPLVCFFVRPPLAPLLLSCAAEAGVGLIDYNAGLQVYARRIVDMVGFAEILHRRRSELSAVRLIAAPATGRYSSQLSLFDD